MGNNTKLHGFTITDGYEANVYGDGTNYAVEYCIVSKGNERGIYCKTGNLTVNWCIVSDNMYDGIYHEGSGNTLTVNNTKIYDNKQNGILAWKSTPTITNCEIHHNGSAGDVYMGIRLYRSADNPYIQNCTIAFNKNYGIYFEDSTNDMDYPIVKNSILWHNNTGDYPRQIEGFHRTYFSCLDPNYFYAESSEPDTFGNISCDPNFAYININEHNLHLHEFSFCINKGNPDGDYSDANDIDGDYRVYDDPIIEDDRVDMGSDEVSCTDEIANDYDFNGDGLVNNKEFALFSKAWLQYDPDVNPDPNFSANWNEKCDLDHDGQVELDDILELANNWLWQACWKDLEKGFAMMSMAMGGGIEMLSMETEVFLPEPTIEEQIEQYEYLIDWLEDLWKTDKSVREEVDKDDFNGMLESLEAWLNELEEEL